MSEFGSIISKAGIEFINVYSEDNKIIKDGEYCYFMFFNMVDYHFPLIGKGMIISSDFTSGMSKEYLIELTEIKEDKKIIENMMIGKPFCLYDKNSKMTMKKIHQICYSFDFKNHLFKIDSFFVRNSIEKVLSLRNEYISVIRQDLSRMLQEVDSIKTNIIQNGNDIR